MPAGGGTLCARICSERIRDSTDRRSGDWVGKRHSRHAPESDYFPSDDRDIRHFLVPDQCVDAQGGGGTSARLYGGGIVAGFLGRPDSESFKSCGAANSAADSGINGEHTMAKYADGYVLVVPKK